MGNDLTTSEPDITPNVSASPFTIGTEPVIPSRVETPDLSSIPAVPPTLEPAPEVSSYEQLGSLPASYQTGQLFLAARDPHWLFVYWDLDLSLFDVSLILEDDATFYLKVFTTAGDLIDQIKVNQEARNWYFPVTDAGVTYFVELGYNNSQDGWSVIGTSNSTLAPSDSFSDGPVEFASVPFHLSFNRLLELVHSDLVNGISLVGALSKLQNSTDLDLQQIAAQWTNEQKRLLETLVGPELVAQISLGSAGIDQIFRQRLSEALAEKLSSPSASELSFLRNVTVAPWNESSLFSGVGSSWSGGESSWSGPKFELGGLSSDTTSWSGLASWEAGVGGESSWAATPGSSWSAQPFGSAPRDFFLHVNAEVIFYGGTHPDAKVWIDGQPISLAPDGCFRYHFRLPDGEFEIPIVAESPDGVEIRSAKLVFERNTTRTGIVGATAQPVWLDSPIGAR